MRPFDQYFLQKEEPIKGCLLALRKLINDSHEEITEEWKYGMPFFCYHGKMYCYIWVHKKLLQPYLGIVEGKKINHPLLIQEKRARMKILLLDASKDLPVKTIRGILKEALSYTQEASRRPASKKK